MDNAFSSTGTGMDVSQPPASAETTDTLLDLRTEVIKRYRAFKKTGLEWEQATSTQSSATPLTNALWRAAYCWQDNQYEAAKEKHRLLSNAVLTDDKCREEETALQSSCETLAGMDAAELASREVQIQKRIAELTTLFTHLDTLIKKVAANPDDVTVLHSTECQNGFAPLTYTIMRETSTLALARDASAEVINPESTQQLQNLVNTWLASRQSAYELFNVIRRLKRQARNTGAETGSESDLATSMADLSVG